MLNSLLSAACAGVLFLILRDTLRSVYLSTCMTLLFAFSATWWKFSTDANAYIPSVLCLLVSFYLVLPDRKPQPLLLAITFFISMAFHQLAVVMFPVLALGIYLQDGAVSLQRRALNAVYFGVIAFVLIVSSYAYLFYLASGSFDVSRLIRWTASFSPDAETRFNAWSNLQYSLRGQVRLFFGGRFNSLRGLVNPLVIVLIVALAAAVALVIFNVLRNINRIRSLQWWRERHLGTRQKSVLLLSLLWATLYLVFLFFWLPQNTFYRVFYLPALIILFALAVAAFARRQAGKFTAVFVTAVVLANFLFLIYPFSHVEKYPPLVFALEMSRQWKPGTVVYYGAQNSDEDLVRYFNPHTEWRLLQTDSLEALPGDVWLETTAIDRLKIDPHAHKESLKELNDGAYKIRFIRVIRGY
jgi:hypothetical protein